MASRVLLFSSLALSILYLPWWATVAVAVFALAFWSAYAAVCFAGAVMDFAYGAPVDALGGFQFVFTAVFVLLALVARYLETAILD